METETVGGVTVRASAQVGRPSRHPVRVQYCEDAAHHALITGFADRQGISFAEAQRIINRAGLTALNLANA